MNGYRLQPDLVCEKAWGITYDHIIFDSLRGSNYWISPSYSDGNDEQKTTHTDLLTSFNSDGYTTGADTGTWYINKDTATYIAWGWKAGGPIGSGSAPSDGGKFKLNGESTVRSATTYTVTGSGYAHGKSDGVGDSGTTYEASYNVDSGFAIINRAVYVSKLSW